MEVKTVPPGFSGLYDEKGEPWWHGGKNSTWRGRTKPNRRKISFGINGPEYDLHVRRD